MLRRFLICRSYSFALFIRTLAQTSTNLARSLFDDLSFRHKCHLPSHINIFQVSFISTSSAFLTDLLLFVQVRLKGSGPFPTQAPRRPWNLPSIRPIVSSSSSSIAFSTSPPSGHCLFIPAALSQYPQCVSTCHHSMNVQHDPSRTNSSL
jgi:hypothetical protein